MNWKQALDELDSTFAQLLSVGFMTRWGGDEWNPSQEDKRAAVMLHTQINSRVATQRLGYRDGVEKAALSSVHALFEATREISTRFPDARHFDAIAWDVLNTHVRPFTAKWHGESERGLLTALDATDEFRAELLGLQTLLQRFDNLLLKIYDNKTSELPSDLHDDRAERISSEMGMEVQFGISKHYGGLPEATASAMNECESSVIKKRRRHYGVREDAHDAVGLALSGGGIRSATFSLGVLVALARRGLLPQFDYLSTVSGGGYIGSFLTSFVSSSSGGDAVGLRSEELPFRRESGEAEALRYVRHHCKYLNFGSGWDRAVMIAAQLYGMFLNGLAVCVFVAALVVFERLLEAAMPLGTLRAITMIAAGAVCLCGVFSLLTLHVLKPLQQHSDYALALSLVGFIIVACLHLLQHGHAWYASLLALHVNISVMTKWLGVIGAVPVLTSAAAMLLGRLRQGIRTTLLFLTGVAAPAFVIGLYLILYDFAGQSLVVFPLVGRLSPNHVLWSCTLIGLLAYVILFDVNSTSPHRHYREKLADSFLIQVRKDRATNRREHSNDERQFNSGVSIPLSSLTTATRGPYHLINCALNVPTSRNIALQGRLTDFFLFSPCYSGSSLTGFYPTREWEAADPHLDLGTAMAISGAAAAPQMGLGTIRSLSFWMALLNIRLGYWVHKPQTKGGNLFAPGLTYLGREMLGRIDERSAFLNVSDGGHIENLGVYELLRRHCKYIVAVDGEQDPKMTFHALTTLQRLASIDLGVRIDIDLDDLRLNEQNLSRSHFRFCRIHYPKAGRASPDEIGYLLYVKLSLTGNEGEFIKRYRLDNPAFPHDSTANQFFNEAQFEAYRSLGEHVGDKLFLRAIVGDLADADSVSVDDWFLRLGKALLEPLTESDLVIHPQQ